MSLARLLDVVRGNDDGGAARAAIAFVVVVGHGGEVVPDGGAEQWIHAHGRLVQDEKLWVVIQCRREISLKHALCARVLNIILGEVPQELSLLESSKALGLGL